MDKKRLAAQLVIFLKKNHKVGTYRQEVVTYFINPT